MSRDEEIYAVVVELPVAERGVYLDRACAGDPALRARLEALLLANDEAETFFASVAPARVVPSPEEKAGDRIGRYRMLQKIGEGGCGVVYMAEQEMPVRRRVALKVIKLGMDTKEVIARFEAERQALALMDHPNIARVLDAGATEAGRPFFVMELVRGIPITRYCDEENLATPERLRLFVQVCQAIQHAHEKGIIHRDIKPTNILVTMHDDVAVPKVIDFGIAKATQGRLTDRTVFTAFEQFLGTPAYMSPEQAQMNDLEVDTRSDIYSLGVLLYELLTGRPPFDPKTLAQSGIDEIRRIICEVEPPRPSTRFSTLDASDRATIARQRRIAPAQLSTLVRGDLDWIAMKALEKNRTRRYATASGLAADIKRHLQNEPVIARPPNAVYRARKFAARHKFGLIATAAVVVALGAGLAFARIMLGAGQQGHRPSPGPTRGTEAVAPSSNVRADVNQSKSIAVLPFTNLGDERQNEYFSDGITNELMNLLGRVSGLRVIGRTSAFAFKGKSATAPEIGRTLDITHFVTGSVQQAGLRARITAALIQADSGEQLWSYRIDTELKDIFAAQEVIANRIAQKLSLTLGTTPRVARTVVPEAHARVLEGRHYFTTRSYEGFAKAEQAFGNALRIDPAFAEAHAGLAMVRVTREGYSGIDGERRSTAVRMSGISDALRAVELDAMLPDGHVALGFAALWNASFAESENHFLNALALNPNSPDVLHYLALLHTCTGRLDAAVAELQKAAALDPLGWLNLQTLAHALCWAERFPEALVINNRVAVLRGHDVFIPNRGEEARIRFQLGQTDAAVESARYLRQHLEVSPRSQFDSLAVRVLWRAGLKQEASDYADVLFKKSPANDYQRGFVLGALDRFEEALPYLEQTPAPPVRFLYWDERWDRWRSDPRFQQLITKLGRAKEYKIARETLARMQTEQYQGLTR